MKALCPALLFFLAALPLPGFQPPAGRPAAKPTPSPTPPPVLEGTVKGPDQKPVEGALVIARSSAGPYEPPLSTRTDASGRFRLTAKRPVPHTVRVEARGLAGRTIEKAPPGAPLDVILARGAVLEGTVRDGATGQPVPAARVQAREEGALSLPWEPTAGTVEALTDAKGRFRLEGLGGGPQSVSARGEYGSGRKSGALPGRPADLYLFPGSTVSGTVWGPGDAPVAGAVVGAESDAPGFRQQPIRPVVADAHGRYELDGLDPGSYRVVARHPDFAPGVAGGVVLRRGDDVQADVVLDKGAVVVGRLMGGVDRTVPGRVGVQALDGHRAPQMLRDVLRAEAGPDGRFRLEGVPAGSHALDVTAPGYAAKRVEMQVAPRAREVDVGDVELETGFTIRGRVRNRAGVPMAGADVYTFQPRPRAEGGRARATAEEDGGFVLAGLEPGGYTVVASAPGHARAERPAEAGAEKVELVLSPAGSITGLVVDDAGRPVEAFQVSAEPVQRDTPGGGSFSIATPSFRRVASPDGRFLLDDLGEGTYVVQASAAELSSGHVSGVKVASGVTSDVGTIRLKAGGMVRGTVSDAAGAPVPGALIRVRGPGRDFSSYGAGPQATSDPAGAFEVRGVPPGPAEVSASHPSYAEARIAVDVDAAKGAAEARLVLVQGGRIEGWARRRDGAGIPGAYVSIRSLRLGGGPTFAGPDMQVTSGDGGFVAEHVEPGRASVALMSRSGSRFTSAQTQEVDVREGETTPVEMRSREILVSGRVTRAGAPLPGVRITVRGGRMMMMMFAGPPEAAAVPAGPQKMTAVTREDGGYEMIVDEPGRTNVTVESVDGRITYPLRSTEIPDTDAYTMDLAFTGGIIAGVVVDAETEQPVPRAYIYASPKKPSSDAPQGSSAQTGPDGRFQLELDPGEFRVRASAEHYGGAEAEVTVGGDGGSDLRLALSRGLTLSGKVVDSRGRGVGGLMVSAHSGEPGASLGGGDQTLPDGSFHMDGLRAGSYTVVARSDLGSFATGSGVRPGDDDVVLTLRPGGRVIVRVLGPDGQTVDRALVNAESIGIGRRTDAQGLAELSLPVGRVELRVRKDKLEGRVTVTVAEGGTAAAEVQLAPTGNTP